MYGEGAGPTHRKLLKDRKVVSDWFSLCVVFPKHSALCMDYSWMEDKQSQSISQTAFPCTLPPPEKESEKGDCFCTDESKDG